MLNIVPSTINASRRLVVLNHPNSFDAELWRKVVTRTELAGTAPNDTLGGLPTLGGLGVLSSEDEAEIDYQQIGDVKVLFGGIYTGSSAEFDSGDGLIPEQLKEAQIECILQPTDPLFVTPDKNDLVMVLPGAGIVLPFEVMAELGAINIHPYSRKFVLNARDDLAFIPGIAAEMIARP